MHNFERYSQHTILGLVCIAAALFPFSVAATNAALGLALAMGLVSGHLWKGMQLFASEFRPLALAFAALVLLAAVSLTWSLDPALGLRKIGREWLLLLVPLLLYCFRQERQRDAILIALSIGLGLHLVYCVLQAFGLAHPVTDGSSQEDPAGLIGHIGFGFVYGLWAGWLIHAAIRLQGWQRWAVLALAGWAIVMIFLGQGRAGYVVAMAILLSVTWKELIHLANKRYILLAAVVLLLAGSAAVLSSGAKERLELSWQQLEAARAGNLQGTEARFGLWLAAWEAWKSSPWFGSGTGGYYKAGKAAIEKHPTYGYNGDPYSHPHNMYLLSMVRWGLVGLLVLISLLAIWIRTGWRLDWRISSAGCLIGLSGLALAVNGLTSSSFEEHFPSILSMLFLGLGLAAASEEKSLSRGQPRPDATDVA
ncbi:MAG TPA: O-antigen ligase family protein [Mariprofundaceae bacterium]|nr:O-antigen ligase family protein [Mariprofundaceae bacterium]